MLSLILRTVSKTPELEYLHYTVSIVNHCLRVKELRTVLLNDVLKPNSEKYTYVSLLRLNIEKQTEVISIPKLS